MEVTGTEVARTPDGSRENRNRIDTRKKSHRFNGSRTHERKEMNRNFPYFSKKRTSLINIVEKETVHQKKIFTGSR